MTTMVEGWKRKLADEFAKARAARESGNEGMARVCARRAAGIAIREYMNRRGKVVTSTSSYEIIYDLMQDRKTSSRNIEICQHLTMRVTEDFTLPIEVDLLEETRELCLSLLPDWTR